MSRAIFSLWRQTNWNRNIAIFLMVAAFVCGGITYAVMRRYWYVEQEARAITWLLTGDIIIALFLLIVVAQRMVQVWIERKRGLAGAKLHSRLVLYFTIIGIVPTIIVTVISAVFIDYGLNIWFSGRIRATIGNSLNVAQAYIIEHQKRIGNDAQVIADGMIRYNIPQLIGTGQINSFLEQEVNSRDLTEATIITSKNQILARGGYSLSMELTPNIPSDAFLRAQAGEVVLLTTPERDRVRALVNLNAANDAYLYIGRDLDAQVVANVRGNEDLVLLYRQLDTQRSGQQIKIAVIFSIFSALILVIAVWFAISLAGRLVKPISRLDKAARKLGAGDLSARVKVQRSEDDLGILSKAFNDMASQLQQQRQDLVDANKQIDERRQFTELVLAGVSAGVVGLDETGAIDLPNRSASELLGMDLRKHIGEDIRILVPDFAPIIDQAVSRPAKIAEGEVVIASGSGRRTLHVRAVSQSDDLHKPVITFDDISELLSAQRKAAWSDIARRIAHEIKNPLTPIQLSAERLKRKYLSQIVKDPETFATCTDTIIRQVGDIGRMVDEFSAFARMPAPICKPERPVQLIRQIFLLQQNANPTISYTMEANDPNVEMECDASQLGRAITNLLKNAAEAIEGRIEGGDIVPGKIVLKTELKEGEFIVSIDDNGCGLPRENRETLTEPYVTTRVKGTGLGLAIVKKIMEDHLGKLILEDSSLGGARIQLIFPLIRGN